MRRVDPYSVACSTCSARAGALCRDSCGTYRKHVHRDRFRLAERKLDMTDTKILEARQKANLLLRVDDELEEANKLPPHSRRQRRQEILAAAKRDYGPGWDEDGALEALNAAEYEWHEPNADDTNALRQLSAQANQGMQGAA